MADRERADPGASPAERLPILVGSAWTLGLDVPADLILPPAPGAAGEQGILASVDPGLAGRIRPGDFLVGGGDFGRGVRASQAVDALRAAGIAAVVAHSIDPAFQEAADRAGLPAVQVNEALVVHTGARLRVDLEGGRVVNMSSGDRFPIRNLHEARLERLRSALDARS
ncbi:hypothetical protein KGQ64_11630, partial [bacterium]|nr:hypothetical protein [bacterium]